MNYARFRKSSHIFQIIISISRNTKCAEMVGFPKDGHIYSTMTFHINFHAIKLCIKAHTKN